MRSGKIALTIFYFLASTLITWCFIEASPLYTSMQQKILSCSIAGAKWSIQIIAAWFLLKEKKWLFFKNIGLTCFVASIILLPYAVLSYYFGINGQNFFIGSLLLAIAVMIIMYAISVRSTAIKIYWWLGWLFCLAIAVTLQLTMVFHIL
jgi:hypothetical protein